MFYGAGRDRVVVVVGNPKRDSRTTAVGEAVAVRLRNVLGIRETTVIELADIAGVLFTTDDERSRAAEATVSGAAALVVASPVYKATYTGLLKAFLDRFPAGGLKGMPTVAVMLGGSPAHALAVEVHLRPLLAELGGNTALGCYLTELEMADLDEHVEIWWDRARSAFGFHVETKETNNVHESA